MNDHVYIYVLRVQMFRPLSCQVIYIDGPFIAYLSTNENVIKLSARSSEEIADK